MVVLTPIDAIKANIESTTRLNSSLISIASANPPGQAPPPNNPPPQAVDLIQRLILEQIRDRADNNSNVLRSAIDSARMQIAISSTQSSATVANATNTIGDLIRQTIRNNENVIKQYVDSDSTNLRRAVDTAKSYSENYARTLDNNARTFADRITKGQIEQAELHRKFAESFIERFSNISKENNDRAREGIEGAVEDFANGIMDSFDSFLQYIVNRISSINNSFDKLTDEEYDNLKQFTSDLFGSSDASTIAGYIWQLVMFIPMLKDILTLSNAPVLARLHELSMKEAHPTLLGEDILIQALRNKRIEDDYFLDTMQKKGYSLESIIHFINNTKTLPSLSDTLEMMRREMIDIDTYYDMMQSLGYEKIIALKFLELKDFQPSVNDVIRFVVRDVYNEQIAEQNKIFEGWDNPAFLEDANKAGIRSSDAKKYWGAHWQLPSPTMGYEMLFRGKIDREKLKSLLKSADYAPAWLDYMVDIAYRVPTRVDTRNMYYDNIIDDNDLYVRLLAYGYNPQDATIVRDYYKKQKVKRNTQSSKAKTLSVNIITDAYTKGIIDRNEAKVRLQTIGFSLSDAELILTEANTQLEKETSDDYTKEIRARFKNIAEKGYISRTLSRQSASEYLQKAGLSSTEAQAILSLCDLEYQAERKAEIINAQRSAYFNYEIEENELKTTMLKQGFSLEEYEKHIKEIRPLREFRHKDLQFSDIKKAFTLGIINKEQLKQQLLSLSYSDRDIEILEKLYFIESVEE